MKRRSFIALSIGAVVALGAGAEYLLSDKSNLGRSDMSPNDTGPETNGVTLHPDESRILELASLAPSGHNTQPWFVGHVARFHWIIGNDSSRWLPAVDPLQRETMLSLGAFALSLEMAASAMGYTCNTTVLASTNQDEKVLEIRLTKSTPQPSAMIAEIERRRTVRTPYSTDQIRTEDLAQLIGTESEFLRYFPVSSTEGQWISEQTVEANVLQANRDPAQKELSDWVRFSSAEARQHRDGLSTGGMEIEGFSGWAVRNFYDKQSVMTKGFRDQGLAKVREGIAAMAGWFLITSPDASVATLLDTGRRLQRLWLKLRPLNIALHPMTQILEEPATRAALDSLRSTWGIAGPVQFILRAGYVADYPQPVSLRRPVPWFVRAVSGA
jgi:hypothetical protein